MVAFFVVRLAFAFLLLLTACSTTSGGADLAAATPDLGGGDGGIDFQACDTYCLRPSDCAVGFASDGYCPHGFRCARTFQCLADGGGG